MTQLNYGIDVDYFKQLLQNMDEQRLQQIVQFARLQGISQDNITNGINSIRELKQTTQLREELL